MALSTQANRVLPAALARGPVGRALAVLIDAGASAPTVIQERRLRTAMGCAWSKASEVVTFITSRPATGDLSLASNRAFQKCLANRRASDEINAAITDT